MRNPLLAMLLILVSGIPVGCGKPKSIPSEDVIPSTQTTISNKVRTDAYLFDAVLRHDGKPTSLRLELFCTDSLVGMQGKGYLGKEAIRARLTKDSLIALFPTRNEFLRDAIVTLVSSASCDSQVAELSLLPFLNGLPESSMVTAPVRLVANMRDEKRARYLLFVPDCDWQVELTYEMKDAQWILQSFQWSGIHATSLSATRREYRRNVNISGKRFEVVIPSDASPISW